VGKQLINQPFLRFGIVLYPNMKGALLLVIAVYLIESAGAATYNLNWARNVGNQGTTTIAIGDTVTWTWTDSRTHTVTSTSFTSSSSMSGSGSTYSYTFTSAGSYSYSCSIHSMMRGEISVATPSPTQAPTLQPTLPPTQAPTVQPTLQPTLAPTVPAVEGVPTCSPTTSVPSAVPSSSAPSAMPSAAPSAAPSSSVPSAAPSMLPTVDLAGKIANQLVALPEASSTQQTWGVTLKVRQHRHSNTQVSFTTRSYCLDDVCGYPGPTIRLKPGDHFTLTLINELGDNPVNASHVHNAMHSPNTTNIHTHGLHVDPDVDSVFVKAEPGEQLVYPYEFPDDHAPGLHWYHAHFHGSSAFQLMGGLVGAMVVDPVASDNVPESISGADSHVLVITKLMLEQETSGGEVTQGCADGWACNSGEQSPLCTGSETSSPFNPFRIYSLPELAAATGSNMDMNIQLTDESDKDLNLVNGLHEPLLNLTTNSSVILRTVHAAGGAPIYISAAATDDGGAPCSLTVLAWDGVYLDERLDYETVSLVAASRVDIEVTCTRSGLHELVAGGKTLMFLYTSDDAAYPAKSPVTSAELAAITRPWYLSDLLSDVDIDSWYTVSINQENKPDDTCHYWMGTGSDCSGDPSETSEECPYGIFHGERGKDPENYDVDQKLVTFEGAINEWILFGQGSAHHPLHVHVNHMQIVSWSSADGDDGAAYYRVGQWRHTIPPVADEVVFRFRAANITGEHVLHCHFQRHEDLGMMDTFLVMNSSAYSTWVRTDDEGDDEEGGTDGWCFHVDSMIDYKGVEYSYEELKAGKEPECSVPHSPSSKGVIISTSCGKTVRVTDTHLMATKKGFQLAYSLKAGDVLFGDYHQEQCTVISVEKEKSTQQYFGLNCVHSEVLASGLRASTFGDFHTLPSWFMSYVGGMFGADTASALGEVVSSWYFRL